MSAFEIMAALGGAVAGSVIAWLWARERCSARLVPLQNETARLEALLAERSERLSELEAAVDQIPQLIAARARLEAELDAERREAEERYAHLKRDAVSTLAGPLEEAIQRVDLTLREVQRDRLGARDSLSHQLEALAKAQTLLQAETGQLSRALNAPSVRGRWGEMQLRRVVELAGMVERCDFTEQVVSETGDGLLRPDLIVHLPGDRRIVVDAKTPLGELHDSGQQDDVHARQVREHMTRLGAKRYWSQFSHTPEYVVMFLPGESIFARALKADPGLLDHGVRHRVLLASPTTLIAMLRAAAYGWQNSQLATNVEEIGATGRELYDHLMTLTKHLARVGRGLGRTISDFNSTTEKLQSEVLPAAERLGTLGAGSARSPGRVVAIAERPGNLQER